MPQSSFNVNRKTALVSACVIGVGALAFDRFVMDAPTPQGAEAADLLLSPSDEAPATFEPESYQIAGFGSRLSVALASLGGTEQAVDAFKDLRSPERVTDQQAGAVDPGRSPEPFFQRHKLGAVVLAGSESIAMVDGEMVRIGQFVDGFELVEIANAKARFSDGRKSIWLHVDRPEIERPRPGGR